MRKLNHLLLLLASTLSSCTTFQMASINYNKLKYGMSYKEVYSLFGPPEMTSKWGNEKRLRWNDIVVVIENDKVVNKQRQYTSTRLLIDAQSFSRDNPTKGKAAIVPNSNKISTEDLEFLPIKNIVASILIENGYQIVNSNIDQPDVIVQVGFGVSDPKTSTEIWSAPVYDYSNQQKQQFNTTHSIKNNSGLEIGKVESQTTSGNPYTFAQPMYQGERTYSTTTTSFTRYLSIEAIDVKKTQSTKEKYPIWKVVTSSDGPSNDVQRLVPAMAIIAKQLVGTNTNGIESGVIYLPDPRIEQLVDMARKPANK